jgi:hypothetical protein
MSRKPNPLLKEFLEDSLTLPSEVGKASVNSSALISLMKTWKGS